MNEGVSLTNFLSPDRSIIRYVVGTAALTVTIQFLYDISKEWLGVPGAIGLVFALIVIVLTMFWWDIRRARKRSEFVPEKKPIDPRKGLIILVSPSNMHVPLSGIEHHQKKLSHCWLLASKESQPTADDLVKIIHQRWPQVKIADVKNMEVNAHDVESTWKRVREIFTSLGPQNNLTERDIIADITGGNKLMTAGMALACMAPNRDMEYMYVPRNPVDGEPISDKLIPLLISKKLIDPVGENYELTN